MVKFMIILANILAATGAILVANGTFTFGYLLFFGSAVLWLVRGITIEDWGLVILQSIFICANIYGLVNLGDLL